MEGAIRATLVLLSVLPELDWALGQRAPCYECEVYKDSHPQSKPYEEIRSHCTYPCECPSRAPTCPPDVSVVRDGCGCCPICAHQQGEQCDGTSLCDEKRGLVCQYPHRGATKGVCQAIKGLPCTVYNRTYDNGETFLLDCRTQCACQNGTYACASLCPQEYISPQGSCRHPRLVDVPGQCCREWMCDSATAQRPLDCRQDLTQWSPCSSSCGLGFSHRVSNVNPLCRLQNETRLCHTRPCEDDTMLPVASLQHARHHHVRRGHECKATQRVSGPVRLRVGPCRSRKRFRPKFCGMCAGNGQCCEPQLSTTIRVEFWCRRSTAEAVLALSQPGSSFWVAESQHEAESSHHHWHTVIFNVQWVLKCHCASTCSTDDGGGGGGAVTAPATNSDGEVILHRVHRTAAP
ncbi:CCN family member 2 [Anabrus simplex]|uniref:CCN family member 2 n=1 Tax=Anabrus simplex TaxID=316456 RepID=UPI0035A2D795